MWWPTSSADSLTRYRVAVAVVSAFAAASLSYYVYQNTQNQFGDSVPGPGLHRSNAVRHNRRRRSRRNTASSISSDGSHSDENFDIGTARPQNDGDTIVDGGGGVDEWWNDPSAMVPTQRAGHNIVSLLFRVSEDNAKRNACVHRGCACNACGMVPIRGVRYRCANCADFDLCETCESQGVHIKTHIFYKIKVPAPPFGPRQMQPVWYTGDPDTCIRNLPKGLMSKLTKETGFERPEIEAFWEQFTFMANTEWREDPDDLCLAMDRKTFERCLVPSGGSRHATPNLIHDRMFSFYDTNNDDLIGFQEFLHGLAYRKRKDKLRKIFEGYDIDGDGFVDRRDFLRMFRAYYVLYKQMHRDILDGLDDQLMGSTEAQQLVTSRQPLSSLFGREGRVPRAEGSNRNEGKIFHANGDVDLESGKVGAVSGDRGDTSSREDVLTRLFDPFQSSWSAQAGTPDSEPDTPYWEALLNPPTSIDELPGLLTGQRRETTEVDFTFEMPSSDDEDEDNNASDAENRSHHSDAANQQALVDSDQYTDAVPTESQLRAQVIAHRRNMAPEIERRRRAASRKQLHERWQRRQFYLDEEEGGLAPDGWQGDEDILVNLNGVAESSKSAQNRPLSPRSRSSSKVRFAEDDDYETRSNHSTSSRSVPERWGGMEIPDEERDAGKEILYQVTQQAFNELLDAIFKAKEDLAVEAAETKKDRDKHRPKFEHILDSPKVKVIETAPLDTPVEETKPVAERSLDELLRTSGYTIEQQAVDQAAATQLATEPLATDQPATAQPANEEPVAVLLVSEELVQGQQVEEELVDDAISDDQILKALSTMEKVEPDVEEVQDEAEDEYRDPTMPQFRPNSDALSSSSISISTPPTSDDAESSTGIPLKSAMKKKGKAASRKDRTIPQFTLMMWKRLDVAEKEAEERKGWGKLSFEEFEEVYKRQEVEGNRLDYLGSWVDFCIP